ncbi:uncharacterized protein [Eurosta solidaginis]|uniref:uncharacterized protein n=1 Tax=Eurosta solidaginis TaxID=178769 RepID=UPI0035308F29
MYLSLIKQQQQQQQQQTLKERYLSFKLDQSAHVYPKMLSLGESGWKHAVLKIHTYRRMIYVCCKHFKTSDYIGSRYLKKDAFPSINMPQKLIEFESTTNFVTDGVDIDSDIVASSTYIHNECQDLSEVGFTPNTIMELTPSMDIAFDIVTVSDPYQLSQHYQPLPPSMEFIELPPSMSIDSSKESISMYNSHPKKMSSNFLIAVGCYNATVYTENERYFKDPRYASEICLEDFATPRRAKRTLKLVKNALNKKVKSLEELVTHLREKNLTNALIMLETGKSFGILQHVMALWCYVFIIIIHTYALI